MNDDELDRRLRATNPARTPKRDHLTPPQEAVLYSITSTRRASEHSSGRWTRVGIPAFAVSAVAAVLVVVLAIGLPFAAAPAAASGPAPTMWAGTDETPEQVLSDAVTLLGDADGPNQAERRSTTTSWSVAIDEAGEPEQTVVISPTVHDLTWDSGLSGTSIWSAGEPFYATAEEQPVPSDESRLAGTVLNELVFAPGEYPAFLPTSDLFTASGFKELLSAYAPEGAPAGDAFLAVPDIQNEWTLTNSQQQTLLKALLAYDDIDVLGTGIDRLGREVLGLRSDSTLIPGESVTLLLSAKTGRILGMETAVIDDRAALPVPVGTVSAYHLWKDTE